MKKTCTLDKLHTHLLGTRQELNNLLTNLFEAKHHNCYPTMIVDFEKEIEYCKGKINGLQAAINFVTNE